MPLGRGPGLPPSRGRREIGRSSITVTLDRYGHLYPGARAEAGWLLDRYLEEHGG